MTGKQFVAILIFTLITVVVWIVADIIHAQPKTPVSPEVYQLMEPIDPKFDTQVIDEL
jgi:hypothetical protein